MFRTRNIGSSPELFPLQNRVHPARSHLAVLLWQTCQILLIEYQREGYQPTASVCPDSPSGASGDAHQNQQLSHLRLQPPVMLFFRCGRRTDQKLPCQVRRRLVCHTVQPQHPEPTTALIIMGHLAYIAVKAAAQGMMLYMKAGKMLRQLSPICIWLYRQIKWRGCHQQIHNR